MKPAHILAHMGVFALLICTMLVGLAQVEQLGGGILWELMTIGSPLLIGIQLTTIINTKE
jgi:hypothetical protein